jgi:predicted DNA-binding transcriptional regulator AlpA
MTWRDDFRAILDQVPAAELADLVGECARLQAIAASRITTTMSTVGDVPEYLDADAVAARLSMSVPWVYSNQRRLGAVKLGSAVRFPVAAVDRYLASKRRAG